MPKPKRKLLSQRHPVLYFIAVWLRRIRRYFDWHFDGNKYSLKRMPHKLPFRVKKHQSVLLKKLGESDMQLQINKVTNLRIAIAEIDGLIIKPGEVFSFCRLVGLPTRRRGFLEGMELSFGKAKPGIGGGLCQISNLIHWLVMHSPLTIKERYHHSFDPFPDDGRVLPFGSGATVFYNYRDYQFANNTPHTFQLNLWLTDKCLEGELRIDTELDYAYHVYEKDHQFLKIGDDFFRKNEIWRKKILKFKGGEVLEDEQLIKNFARVTYTPDNYIEQ
ncbi:vancomycin resistance protein [Dysgonomonas sp. 216]|uniref:VanW family protein n=1 Tax=Dysgonomonas sp. 216 TaxID=2302934 RepID=UPI0013D391CD|nr:VanW family protein [Dysgonomonas sp. 216]NDW19236.1 vancomycin resistance protein [Dysgonomonas sp. 216]